MNNLRTLPPTNCGRRRHSRRRFSVEVEKRRRQNATVGRKHELVHVGEVLGKGAAADAALIDKIAARKVNFPLHNIRDHCIDDCVVRCFATFA